MMSSNILRSSSVFAMPIFLRQTEVISADYAVLDQSAAAFGDLLFSLFSVFQTNWISKYRKSYYRSGTFMQIAPETYAPVRINHNLRMSKLRMVA